MTNLIRVLFSCVVIMAPVLLLEFAISRINSKREKRHQQYIMPILALVYSIAAIILLSRLNQVILDLLYKLPKLLTDTKFSSVGTAISNLLRSLELEYWLSYLTNFLLLLAFFIVKPIFLGVCSILGRWGSAISKLFYDYDAAKNAWYLKNDLRQGRTYLKTLYVGTMLTTTLLMVLSRRFYREDWITTAFMPAFCAIIIGELYFFMNGLSQEERESSLAGEGDTSQTVSNISSLRKVLRQIFGDKLVAENVTVSSEMGDVDSKETLLDEWEQSDNKDSEAYAAFMRALVRDGIKLDTNYLVSGHELLQGKNILFNNPFYYDLIPYAFYAMNHTLMRCKKTLVILGRHGSEGDITNWCENGLEMISRVHSLWRIGVLGENEEELDVGLLKLSDVCNLAVHKKYEDFLSQVGFVVLIEPSKLITTSQIGLNSIIHYCNGEKVTFCSVDKNCDGLLDALSHILMTDICEVSATNRHFGVCAYMCWASDQEMLQHRLLPNVSHYLGIGTELSFVALRNQVSDTCWFGGDAFPVSDMRWIARQYYYDLLRYANLPANQDLMNHCFTVSPALYAAGVRKNRYLTVEDEDFNMFEVKRNFATRATGQSFINVISPEYLLRDYMADNETIFNVDPKAIPYIVADYARTRRNVALRLFLRMCEDAVSRAELVQELLLVGEDVEDPVGTLWQELCRCYQPIGSDERDEEGKSLLRCTVRNAEYVFSQNLILEKKAYSIQKGIVETSYYIENLSFREMLFRDMRCAGYIAEEENGERRYIGSELCGHVFQKHLPGQFFTVHGKYYEMLGMTTDGQVLLRRAADYVTGRPAYRQLRHYVFSRIEESEEIGARKEIAGLRVDRCLADICVNTNAYWSMEKYNDFQSGRKVSISGIQKRKYCRKGVLRLDFNGIPGFSHDICLTLSVLINEVFRTLFAENQDYIAAVTAGDFEQPLTYSLCAQDGCELGENCIYIVEDSQLDIGLLVAVERNLDRILYIICDYLDWHFEALDKSMNPSEPTPIVPEADQPDEVDETKKTFFGKAVSKIKAFFKKLFKKGENTGSSADSIGETEIAPGSVTEPESTESDTSEELVIPAEDTQDVSKTKSAEDEPVEDESAEDASVEGEPVENEPVEDESAEDESAEDEPAEDEPAEDELSDQPVLFSRNYPHILADTEPMPDDGAEPTVDDNDGEPEMTEDAAVEGTEGVLAFEAEQVSQSTLRMERPPYHQRYYLLFGGSEVPEGLALQETLEFLRAYGYDNGALKQARHGLNTAVDVEKNTRSGKSSTHYCDFCGVELLAEFDVLADGRERCTKCSRTAVKTADEFSRIHKEVVRNLEIFYGLRLDIPIHIEMVNAKKLHKRLGKSFVPTGNSDGRILGVAIPGKKGEYTILMENGAPRMASILTMVHEMTHIWQFQNWNRAEILKKYGKSLELEVYEGMAKWSEIQYAYLLGESEVAKREQIITALRQDEYGRGFLKYAERYPLSSGTHLQDETPFANPNNPL